MKRTSPTWNRLLAAISGAINGYKVVVEKSTVPVYTSDWVRKIMLRNAAAPDSFDVASNPEFLREGTAVTDFLYPDRIVVGADTERCAEVLRKVYAPLTDGSYYKRKDAIPAPDRAQIPPPLIITSAKSAELIKHASNAFLAMKISFVNAVASICESVGADVQQVCQGIGTDSRIGPRFLESRDRLRRVVLSQGSDGLPLGGAGMRLRVPSAGRSHAHQRGPAPAISA